MKVERATVLVHEPALYRNELMPLTFAVYSGDARTTVYALELREDGWLVVEEHGSPGLRRLFPPHAIVSVTVETKELET